MPDKKFDLAILGGGPGGYTAAIRGSQLGLKVALVEKGFLGGTCLNRGCIPSKAFIHIASVMEESKGAKTLGVSIPEVDFDWPKNLKYKERCVLKLRKGVESLMKKNGIDVFSSHGKLSGISTIDTGDHTIEADHIILANGSEPRTLPSLPVDGEKVLSSAHALFMDKLPGSILIVGAGAIGCEFAYILGTFGVDVTIVEFLERALPMEDEEISHEYESFLKRKKIRLHVNASVENIEINGDMVISTVKPRNGQDEFSVTTEKVLVSVGRKAAIEGSGIEENGIPVEKGFVKVDDFMKTGVGNIRAIGDLTGGLMLAHKASSEGILAAEDIAGIKRESIDYDTIPRATYSRPEVASVGLDEKAAEEKYGDSVRVGRFPFSACPKAVIQGQSTGFAKLISESTDGKIVGAHVIGEGATDIIATAVTAIMCGMSAKEFAHVIQAHPTLSEVWHETAHGIMEGTLNY